MDVIDWPALVLALAGGATAGMAFWLLAHAGLALAGRWPQRLPFAAELLAASGERERQRHRRLGASLAAVLAALLAGATAAAALAVVLVAATDRLPAWPAWAWWLLAAGLLAVIALAVYLAARLWLARREARFAWAARAAVGSVLQRLNLAGNRVFHEVVIEGSVIDHVLVGPRGVFAVNVVPRRLPKQAEGRPTAELRNGKLWLAGAVEALPVGDAARNMTLLSAALHKAVGHRVAVRSVLALPGWHCAANGTGNHLVLNESNLVMLTSWNTPDAYLMDEDCTAIQSALQQSSRAERLD